MGSTEQVCLLTLEDIGRREFLSWYRSFSSNKTFVSCDEFLAVGSNGGLDTPSGKQFEVV